MSFVPLTNFKTTVDGRFDNIIITQSSTLPVANTYADQIAVIGTIQLATNTEIPPGIPPIIANKLYYSDGLQWIPIVSGTLSAALPLTGDGSPGDEFRIIDGTVVNDILYWDGANWVVGANPGATTTLSPIQGDGSLGNPITFIDGTLGGQVWAWNGAAWALSTVAGTQTLAQTLVLGNTTGGNDIIVSAGDDIVLSGSSLLTSGSAAGTALAIRAAIGNAGTNGGAISITSGSSDFAARTSGVVTIASNSSSIAAADTGAVNLQSGSSTFAMSGDVTVQTGNALSSGGVSLTSGMGTGGNSGPITLLTGTSTAASGGISGNCGSGLTGGTIVFEAGQSTGADGGLVEISSGTTTFAGSVSGMVLLTSGNQFPISATNGSGAVTVKSGTGGSTSGISGIVTVSSGDTIGSASGAIVIVSGEATTGSTGNVSLGSGDVTGAGTISGDVNITTGDANTGAGDIFITCGASNSGGVAGDILIISGLSVTADGGFISLVSGQTQNTANVTGDISISTGGGAVYSTGSGNLDLLTGDSVGPGIPSGDINILTGQYSGTSATTVLSGAINIFTGAIAGAGGNGGSGDISLFTGNVNTGGDPADISGTISIETGTASANGSSGPIIIETGEVSVGTGNPSGYISIITGLCPLATDDVTQPPNHIILAIGNWNSGVVSTPEILLGQVSTTKPSHIASIQATEPLVSVGTILSNSTDTCGRVSVPALNTSVTVTFDESYRSVPMITITPFDATTNSVLAQMYISASSISAFTVSVVTNTNAWAFNYHVIGLLA